LAGERMELPQQKLQPVRQTLSRASREGGSSSIVADMRARAPGEFLSSRIAGHRAKGVDHWA
jgi:hypothetical protein